jgi:photosystem II stability/assembly factor-like uncharacterized protein
MHADTGWRSRLALHALVAVFIAAALHAQQPAGGPPQGLPVEPLQFRYMGPASAGRISAVAGIPGDKNTYYAGAASGGVWKTTDGGQTFEPIFDGQTAQAIGALAVAPSSPATVWAGTGEAWAIRDADIVGDGIYKSTDAGKTWANAGLRETGRIGRILVHPTNPDIVFACALGRATGPQEERGVFRTTDGGRSWQRVLFVNAGTGCSGIAMDPNNPNVLLAGTWEVVMHTWAMFSGGPGSGVYRSRDGGTTWQKLEHPGLPKSPVGKIDVAIAPSNAKRMFALIQTANQGSLWRSDDGGDAWTVVSWDRRLIGRAGYYIRVAVNPQNPDEVLIANSSFHRSTDGGLTFPPSGGGGGGGCGDCHDIWIDPTNGDHWVATGDGGMGITRDHAKTFMSVSLPIGQMYHVAVDDQVPYWIYSNRQDDGTMRGPSNSPVPVANVPSYAAAQGGRGGGRGGAGGGGGGGRGAAAIPWQAGIGGCESGFTIPVPGNPDVIWASCYANEVTRFDNRLGSARSVSPWIHTLDSEPNKTKYRCHWTPPLAFDPFEEETVYYGCQVIFKTDDRGQTWSVISPDLSTQDPSRIVSSGGVIGDNLGQFYGEVVFAIAPSKIQKGLIWAGTNDGLIWYTRDGGGTWTNVTKNVAGIPSWGTIRKIEPSRFDAATAYVVVDAHLMDNREPFIYKTTDLGRTWTKISDGLPKGHPLGYVLSLAENPNRQGMLFAGTGNAFYYSMDDGRTWTPFKEGLPAAPVTWIEVQPQYHDVVVSTYGRGLYLLRDITRLEQRDQVVDGAGAFLYQPRAGVRSARAGSAEFLYALKAESTSRVTFEVLDGAGTVIRTLDGPASAGLSRVVWDLRYDGPTQVELKTIPPDNPHIWEEARFKGRDTRPIVHWGIQGPQRQGPLATPGRYSVRMTAAGQTFTRPLEVLRDPKMASGVSDLAPSTATQIRIRDDINASVAMINRLETMRKQIEDLLTTNAGKKPAEQALRDLDQKMMNVELQLLSRTDLHSDDKWYVEAYKVYMNLVWLSGVVGSGAGDVQGGADFRPTDASLQVLDMIEKDLAAAKAAFASLIEKDVPAFNRTFKGSGLITIGALQQ